MEKKFSVFAQNLAYYNEGELVGGWLDLPQSPEVINKYLKEVVKIDEEHEEYEIADVDGVPLPYESIQWGDLYKINDLAIIYYSLLTEEKDAIQAHLELEGQEHYTIEELINICLQADDIVYYPYSFEGLEYNQDCSPELKLGYTIAEETGIYLELQKLGCLDYFDFEKYGESYTYGSYEVFSKGYLITDYDIVLDYYSSEEIKEKVKEILQEKQKEREVQEIEI